MPDDRLELSVEQRALLDAMDPVERHETLDRLHAHHVRRLRARDSADATDRTIEMVRPALEMQRTEAAREGLLDLLTGLALSAEGMRAVAADDPARAQELFASAKRFIGDPRRWRIRPIRDPEDAEGDDDDGLGDGDGDTP